MPHIGFVLAGLAGNGKSSTGNSILGSKQFKTRSTTSSDVSQRICTATSKLNDHNVTVVDGIGFSDAVNNIKFAETIIKLAENAVALFVNGLSAFLLVIKYGSRFTKQEVEFVKTIKSIIGADIFRNYGIIVMTYGDSFELDSEDSGQTFEDWCRYQMGEIQNLFKECNHRYALFNNRANDGNRIAEQNRKLFSKVAEILKKVTTYTIDNFRQAESTRKQLRVKSKLSQLEQKINAFADEMNRRIRHVEQSSHSNSDKAYELNNIGQEVEQFKKNLKEETDGANVADHIFFRITVIQMDINTKRALLMTIDPEASQPHPPRRNKYIVIKILIGGIITTLAILLIILFASGILD